MRFHLCMPTLHGSALHITVNDANRQRQRSAQVQKMIPNLTVPRHATDIPVGDINMLLASSIHRCGKYLVHGQA